MRLLLAEPCPDLGAQPGLARLCEDQASGNQPRVNTDIGNTFKSLAVDASTLSTYLRESKGVVPGAVAITEKMARDLRRAGKQIPKDVSQQEKPIAIGVGEAFTTTVAVAAYFALMVTLPLLLYQLYAFVIPALSRNERKVAIPTMIAAPFLFLAGATFTYFAVLPPAVHFLQGYNSSEYQNLVQAKSYYTFEIMLLMGIGLAFQVPLLALGLQKVGIISANTLTLNWRYATVLIAVIVAALPGVDPVTMTMETLPLVGLYVAEYRAAEMGRTSQLPARPRRGRSRCQAWRPSQARRRCRRLRHELAKPSPSTLIAHAL